MSTTVTQPVEDALNCWISQRDVHKLASQHARSCFLFCAYMLPFFCAVHADSSLFGGLPSAGNMSIAFGVTALTAKFVTGVVKVVGKQTCAVTIKVCPLLQQAHAHAEFQGTHGGANMGHSAVL